jgi:hypothetical protein
MNGRGFRIVLVGAFPGLRDAERPGSRMMAGIRPLLPGWCQSWYVASILSRRIGLPWLMWDLGNTPLRYPGGHRARQASGLRARWW